MLFVIVTAPQTRAFAIGKCKNSGKYVQSKRTDEEKEFGPEEHHSEVQLVAILPSSVLGLSLEVLKSI